MQELKKREYWIEENHKYKRSGGEIVEFFLWFNGIVMK
jgi:hypothetical protein